MWSTPDTITISIAIQFLDRSVTGYGTAIQFLDRSVTGYGTNPISRSLCNRLRDRDPISRSLCNRLRNRDPISGSTLPIVPYPSRLRVAIQSQSSIRKSSIKKSSVKKMNDRKSSIKKSLIGQSSIKNSGLRELRVVHTRSVCDLSSAYRYSLVQLSCLSFRPIRERHFFGLT